MKNNNKMYLNTILVLEQEYSTCTEIKEILIIHDVTYSSLLIGIYWNWYKSIFLFNKHHLQFWVS